MKSVIIVSGGMDSVVLLHWLVKKGDLYYKHETGEVYALSFNYGQRHNRELTCASYQCSELDVPHKIIDLKWFGKELANNSALTGDIDVPHGHYAAENMKQTVVPFRNGLMLSLAVAYAENIGAKTVYYGAHGGDHFIYPDCRSEFVRAMSLASVTGTFNKVFISTPYNDWMYDKGHIAKLGGELGVDFSNTHTCYEGKSEPCGKCGACQERAEAFEKAKLVDPLVSKEDS